MKSELITLASGHEMTKNALFSKAEHIHSRLSKAGFDARIAVRYENADPADMHIQVSTYDDVNFRHALTDCRYKVVKKEKAQFFSEGTSIFINLI